MIRSNELHRPLNMTRKITHRPLHKTGRKENSPEKKLVMKEQRKEWESGWRKEYFQINPKKRLLWAARKRAKERGLEFSITEDDILIPNACPYLGTPMKEHAPRGTSRSEVMSLDRIDPSMGYIPNNIEVISHLANTMKNNATKQELIRFASTVLHRFGLRDIDTQQRSSI